MSAHLDFAMKTTAICVQINGRYMTFDLENGEHLGSDNDVSWKPSKDWASESDKVGQNTSTVEPIRSGTVQ